MPRKKATKKRVVRKAKKVEEKTVALDERRVVAFWIIVALAAILVLAM